MVGSSAFMVSFSAWTFTGAAGAAYEAGLSVLIIYASNAFGFALSAIWFAPWFRQLRVTTAPEVLIIRYNEPTRQLSAYHTLIGAVFFSALWLYGLGIFCSSVFGLDIYIFILVLGIVVILYSLVGGSWGVMANDFLQNIILFPLCLLIAVLCLMKFGGIGGFISAIRQADLLDKYSLIKPEGTFPGGLYGAFWAFAIFLNNSFTQIGMGNVNKYAAVKDGKEASRAAWLACLLMFFGGIVWLIPPITGRLLFQEQIAAVAITVPAESAYAVTAMNILPTGLTGLMVVAIFGATLSSMDTGLNRNSAIVIRDLYPCLCSLCKVPVCTDQGKLLRAGRILTLFFGSLTIGLALYFAGHEGAGIFELMLTVMAVIGAPSAPANILGLFMKRAHEWSAIVSLVAGWVPATLSLFSAQIFGQEWTYQFRFLIIFATASVAYSLTVFFWETNTAEYRQKVKAFFERMYRPIQFTEEIGTSADHQQLKILGLYCAIISTAIALLALIPTSLQETIATLCLAAFLAMIAAAMLFYAGKVARAEKTAACNS